MNDSIWRTVEKLRAAHGHIEEIAYEYFDGKHTGVKEDRAKILEAIKEGQAAYDTLAELMRGATAEDLAELHKALDYF